MIYNNALPLPVNRRVHGNRTEGHSMLNVSVDISNANAGMLDAHTVKAHVHSQRCDVNKGGPHYMKDPSGPDSGTNIFEVSLIVAGARGA